MLIFPLKQQRSLQVTWSTFFLLGTTRIPDVSHLPDVGIQVLRFQSGRVFCPTR